MDTFGDKPPPTIASIRNKCKSPKKNIYQDVGPRQKVVLLVDVGDVCDRVHHGGFPDLYEVDIAADRRVEEEARVRRHLRVGDRPPHPPRLNVLAQAVAVPANSATWVSTCGEPQVTISVCRVAHPVILTNT
jgi:hypothetical protein